jgi:phosphate:Na+ symporter
MAAVVANYHAKRTARAHLLFNIIGVIWVLILFYPFLKLVTLVAEFTGSDSPYLSAAAIPVAISLFHTIFNLSNTFLLLWFIKPIAKLVERIVPVKLMPEKEIDEPKFLSEKMLKYPETLIVSLENESKYLYENAIFEIVAHALNIHRQDVISDLKIKKIVKKSKEDLKTDVLELYYTKVKKIYGQIIRYATKGQSSLALTEDQNKHITEIKVVNRKMVEILREIQELSKNVTLFQNSDNEFIRKEYDKFRKKLVKVLRVIYLFRTQDNSDHYYTKLLNLKEEAKNGIHENNESINKLIRKNLITVDMGSSLVNDNDNVYNIIKKLIEIAELIYARKDTLLENGA